MLMNLHVFLPLPRGRERVGVRGVYNSSNVVPLQQSQEMVDAIKAAGGNPKFTIYPGVGHDSWTATYSNEEFWKWLLGQRKK